MARRVRRVRHFTITLILTMLAGISPAAQEHEHTGMVMPAEPGWQLMQDAVVFVELNRQSGPRGGSELVAPNWWMGMGSRKTARSQLTFIGMFSLDPATVGTAGYRELFQAGEALNGRPLIDRQHPHDFLMQIAAVWRLAVSETTGFTIAGGPSGEPALGPVAFMHRASAAENPTAPLGHHTFDSSHIAFGVVTAAVDHGPWVAEGSVFNGREPDQHRWNLDLGPLDSFSGRLWYRPAPEWEFQISSGRLKNPEELEPGNITRSTASAAWTRRSGADFTAVSAGFGRNDTDRGAQHALFVEGTRHAGLNSVYGRFEAVQAETAVLLFDDASVSSMPSNDSIFALTVGGVRDVPNRSGFEAGVGADVTWYGAPDALRRVYGNHPFGLHVFFRLRPPPGKMGRMLNMRMSQPMAGHEMAMPLTGQMP